MSFRLTPPPDDFPAAHSMDTQWYAVDQEGHVAVFVTGENGHVPTTARDDDVLWQLQQLRQPQTERQQAEDLAPEFGFFGYEYDMSWHGAVAPYYRSIVPQNPLHIDELPPELRRRCKAVRFEAMTFAHSELVQPLDFVACHFWGTWQTAYLCGDGKTVRPVPGKESDFAEFCREARADDPDWAAQVVFESPPEASSPVDRPGPLPGNDSGKETA
jgi:hypothetical protein